ncbi:unnamed protein product [Thlaspi arvense]|uniref:PABC domain-containing protein n=1 Tax=Thlaspi arvense TaxID=13288 RepID=A0AAU9RZE6_THLAR|nr:unnamed protein product [Thlaspi arvense]
MRPIVSMTISRDGYSLGVARFRRLPPPVPLSVETLTKMLGKIPPEAHRSLLGENLYPLVEKHQPLMVAKITGMLLELDQTECLRLIESPEALKLAVEEAVKVLEDWIPKQSAEELRASFITAKAKM